jgi:carboxyl-terminal processing protease
MLIRSKWIKKITVAVILIFAVFLTSLSSQSTLNAADSSDSANSEVHFLLELQEFIKSNYVREINDLTILKGAIKGMVESLDDPYSEYFTQEGFKNFNDSTSGNFNGIGIVITSKEKMVTIVSVLDETPAKFAGLKPGDYIVEIDGNDVKGLSVAEVASRIKGQSGTNVSLGVIRSGESQILKFNITRDIIKVNPIESKILGQGIGYLKITEFNDNTVENLDSALNQFKEGGVIGIVLDLRNNPGGFLNQAVDVASRFVPEGPIVNLVSKDGRVQTFTSQSQPHPFKLVVLVNGGTASAAEILAGAIKDREIGVLVGENTFGKATVQRTLNLGVLGAIKLTIARYTTPNGTDINKTGITPNFLVEFDRTDILKDLLPLDRDKTLKYGCIGLEVLALQQRLKVLDLFKAVPDGVYGPRTQRAVMTLQQQKGIPINGIADSSFYRVINEAIKEKVSSQEDAQLRKAIEILKDQMKRSA